jgi:hypothetical protein
MSISFDIISDLDLYPEDKFDWTDKVTSLFCIVAGNLSHDLKTIQRTLTYLSTFYQGVFYIDGGLEHFDLMLQQDRVEEIGKMCDSTNNTVFLHNNVVVLNGVALIAINGWYGNYPIIDLEQDLLAESYRREDIVYLYNTVKKLQLHMDVKDIVVVSNCIPDTKLFFGDTNRLSDDICPTMVLTADTEKKVKNWIFGATDKMIDTTLSGIRFVSNPCVSKPYWAKRIEI